MADDSMLDARRPVAGRGGHFVGRFEEAALTAAPGFDGHSDGYRQAWLVQRDVGSVHTGLSVAELGPGGGIDRHVHSFEESFYILSGEAVISIGDRDLQLTAGDYGALKVGTPHAWRTAGGGPVRWLQMAAPQPKPPGAERDTFFAANRARPGEGEPLDPASCGSLLGHFDASQIPPLSQRTSAGAGLEGVFLKWLIDEQAGAVHHRLLFIEYQPGVSIALHDHTFEESYFILSGEVEATLDGRTYRAGPGDVLWTGVGCVHTFANVGAQPVRWLETFAPQPPRENVFRFVADWEKTGRAIEQGTA